jgi:hypothetical protein
MLNSNPQRLAWITMLGALAIFCLLCISTIIFARWLVFESPTQLNVTLHVGRATVGWPNRTPTKKRSSIVSVGHNDRLITDITSQGTWLSILFRQRYCHRDDARKQHREPAQPGRPRFNQATTRM